MEPLLTLRLPYYSTMHSVSAQSPIHAAAPKFWRDASLPFIEAREIQDGRNVCYAKHTHETFSIGAIIGGESVYVNSSHTERVSIGSVVVINPGDVHACNPIDDQPWSYRMLYVDRFWLAQCQARAGWGNGDEFRAFLVMASMEPSLYKGLNNLYSVLVDDQIDAQRKVDVAMTFFIDLACMLDPVPVSRRHSHAGLKRIAEYIRDNCTQTLRLDDMCTAAGLSMAHMIRSFKVHYGMTPHAYQMNCRVEYSREQLRLGRAIADVAGDAGFSDQAHLQRVFKKLTAATPGQYRR